MQVRPSCSVFPMCPIIYLVITAMCVSCREFVHQNHQNSFNRPLLRPNSESHEKPVKLLNDMRSERAHPRPKTIGFEDRAQRPPESRPIPQEATHVRQQMPYQSIDRHLRSANGRHKQLVGHEQNEKPENSHSTKRRTDKASPLKKTKPVHELPFLLTDNYIDNSKSYIMGNRRHPEIYEDGRHLRIQSPLEREEEFNDNLQNIDRSNDWRPIQVKHRDRNPQTFFYHNNDVNRDPLQHLSQKHRQRNIDQNDKRHRLNPRPNPKELGMKMVLPKNKAKEEMRFNGFETFTSNHKHEETDKIYPIHERDGHNSQLLNDMPPEEEPTYRSAPESEVQYQKRLNHFPPLINDEEEEVGKYKKPFEEFRKKKHKKTNHYVEDRQSNLDQIPNYFRNHFLKQNKQSLRDKHMRVNQRNEANHQNFDQNRDNNPNHHFRSIDANAHTFRSDNPNNYELQRDNPSHERNRFFNNQYERMTTLKPEQHPNDNHYGRPVKKAIEIVREITEILPVDDDIPSEFEPPIATPAPPDLPMIPNFDAKEDIDEKPESVERDQEESPRDDRSDIGTGRSVKVGMGKDESFYDDDEEKSGLTKDYDRPKDTFGKTSTLDDEDKRKKSKFEKEVDLSADELENYFDKEFANEAEKDEEGMKRIEFDDEPKESKQIAKKSVDTEDADVEADYKSSTDFLKNHDDFLNKIDKENEKFRKRTDDKVEKEEDDEAEAETEKKVDDGEKELDGETEKKEGEESEDKTQTEQKTNKDDNKSSDEEETNDSNDESKDKANQTEGEEEESETKEGSEKSGDNDDNQQSDEKNEEQDDRETKDEEKSDNTESDETNESNDEKATKSDKCMESNCDKELLKEESKESKNTEQLKLKQSSEAKEEVEGKTSEDKAKASEEKSSSIETKPIESKVNRNTRISETLNFAPFFIDLKRINPNKSNIRKALENNESLTSRSTSATQETSPQTKNAKHRTQSVSPAPHSTDANTSGAGKGGDNAVENRRVVNSIKDIIRSQNLR